MPMLSVIRMAVLIWPCNHKWPHCYGLFCQALWQSQQKAIEKDHFKLLKTHSVQLIEIQYSSASPLGSSYWSMHNSFRLINNDNKMQNYWYQMNNQPYIYRYLIYIFIKQLKCNKFFGYKHVHCIIVSIIFV